MRRRILASVGGKPLPYDAEVEYLESTGTQYVNTKINNNDIQDAVIEIEYGFIKTPERWRCAYLFGSMIPSNRGVMIGAISRESDTVVNATMGTTIIDNGIIVSRFNIGGIYKKSITVNGNPNGSISCDGASKFFNGKSVNLPIYLFANNQDGVANPEYAKRIGIVSIKTKGMMIAKYIPVRFTNENGKSEGAMYNTLGVGGNNPDGTARNDGLFRNAGTGAFVIGPDK